MKKDLGIPAPDVNLAVGSRSQAEQTANVMLIGPVFIQEKLYWVVVLGVALTVRATPKSRLNRTT